MAKKTRIPHSLPAPRHGGLKLNSALRDQLFYEKRDKRYIAPEDIKKMFSPPATLGTPPSAKIALDSALEANGHWSLLQHSLEMGMYGSMSSFLGYAALQNIAQNGLIRACIETVADDMTRAWIELSRSAEEDGADASQSEVLDESEARVEIEEIEAEIERLELQKVLHQVCEMVGYYGGCLLYLDTGVEGADLRHPLNLDPKISREAGHTGFLKAVRVVDPINVFPGQYNSTNPLAGDYYQPKTWWVLGQEVHATRLIRIVANEAPLIFKPAYNFLGIPQAQILWDYICHFQENRDSANRLLNKFSTFIFKTQMADIINGNAQDLNQLQARMHLLAHTRTNDSVLAIDMEGEDVVKLETPLGGVTDIVRQSFEIIAAMNRTPAVKLLGISPSGFNATGESDLRNYYDHIKSQQEKVIRPALGMVLEVIQLSLFGKVDDSIVFEFCPLSEEDKASNAMTRQTNINSLCQLLDREVLSPEEVRQVLISDPDSGLNDLDVDAMPNDMGIGDLSQSVANYLGLDMPTSSLSPLGNQTEAEAPAEEGEDIDSIVEKTMALLGIEESDLTQDKESDELVQKTKILLGMDAKEDEVEWITTKTGVHIPIKEGQSKKDAVYEFFSAKQKEKAKPKTYSEASKQIEEVLSEVDKILDAYTDESPEAEATLKALNEKQAELLKLSKELQVKEYADGVFQETLGDVPVSKPKKNAAPINTESHPDLATFDLENAKYGSEALEASHRGDSLSKGEKGACIKYSGPAYGWINEHLRGISDEPLSKEEQETIDNLDSTFKKVRTKEPMVVYRGMSKEHLGKLKKNMIVTDKGFMSTTVDFNVASDFAYGDDGLLLQIRVPKGASAVSLDPEISYNSGEREVLLNRGTSLKIVAFKKRKGYTIAVAEMI